MEGYSKLEYRSIQNRGIFAGVISGLFWGLDTVLTGIVLGMSPMIDTKEAIFLHHL